MSDYSTEEVMDFYKQEKDKEFSIVEFKTWDFVQIRSALTHDKGYENQFGIVYRKMNTGAKGLDGYYVMSFDKNRDRYWVCGFSQDEVEPMRNDIINMRDCENLLEQTKKWFEENDKSMFSMLMKTKEGKADLEDNKHYHLDFDKIQGMRNIELTLLEILFQNIPISLTGEIIKEHGLENYIK